MGRSRKLKVVEPVYPVVTFGDNTFEIHPIADRDDDYAYDDAARFLTLAIPVGSKVFSEFIKLGEDNPEAIARVQKAQAEGEEVSSVFSDLIGFLATGDFGNLIDEVSDVLPKLTAIACHYTDPDVTERDIKRWTKNPLHKEMWRAVIAQMSADNIMAQIGSLQGMMGEFSSVK